MENTADVGIVFRGAPSRATKRCTGRVDRMRTAPLDLPVGLGLSLPRPQPASARGFKIWNRT
eukprot:9378230-Pyramimonas_sp.AAC.1